MLRDEDKQRTNERKQEKQQEPREYYRPVLTSCVSHDTYVHFNVGLLSPERCAPGVCPARPDPQGFSWGRSERDFRGPASIGHEEFLCELNALRTHRHPPH
ncbi:hypothetical protein X777_06743, partial [Ooceraea biroi]